MPPKRKRESLEPALRSIPRSGANTTREDDVTVSIIERLAGDETTSDNTMSGDENISENEVLSSEDEGNGTIDGSVVYQDASTYDQASMILNITPPPTPQKLKIKFPGDADNFDVKGTWPPYQTTNLQTADPRPKNEWERRLEKYRLEREELVAEWRTLLKEQESEELSAEEMAKMGIDPDACDWHEPKMDERIQPMTYAELAELAQELGLSSKLRKTSSSKLTSLKASGQQATLAQLPIEICIPIVRYMLNNWQARQTDLYDTLYQIRITDVLNAAYCSLSDAERRQLPSSDCVDRIQSFVTLHCNFTQAQLLPFLQRLQAAWPGPGMVRWAALQHEQLDRIQRIVTPWFKLTCYLLENNNFQHMCRLLLRDIRRESGEMWSVELRLPTPPPTVTSAPSIGRCLNMGAFDEWMDLFDTNNIADERHHRNLRYNLWSSDQHLYSFSTRNIHQGHTTHAMSRGNSITEACLFESCSYARYPALDPRGRPNVNVREAQARIRVTGDVIDRQWLDFINHGQ